MSELFTAWTPGQALPMEVALFSLLLAFILSQIIAAGYVWTFRGMSYSRSFVQTIALGSVVAAMLMLAINNSIAAGLGIAGSLAIVRFRTAMRDPRDMVFVFASMGAGIAAGLRAWTPAILGTAIFFLAAAALAFTELGSQRVFDGLLRFQAPANPDTEEAVAQVLRRATKSFALVTLRDVGQGTAMEHAYQVRLGAAASRTDIIQSLTAIAGISDITFLLQEPTVEL